MIVTLPYHLLFDAIIYSLAFLYFRLMNISQSIIIWKNRSFRKSEPTILENSRLGYDITVISGLQIVLLGNCRKIFSKTFVLFVKFYSFCPSQQFFSYVWKGFPG